jgi:starch-binding outer membrane protein, SusD/RagB family
MIMIIKNKFFYLLLSMMLFVHCSSDMLDIKPVYKFTESNVFTDSKTLEIYVNGCYSGFYTFGRLDWWFALPLEHFTSPLSDENYAKHSFWGTTIITENGALSPSNLGCFQWKWGNTYAAIKNCNLFMDNISLAKNIDPLLVGRFTDEVRFIRAYLYFDLLRYWGGVPIVQTVPTLDNYEIIPRNSPDEVIDFIVSELDIILADSKLPNSLRTCSDAYKGRATTAAVHALKARALLFSASPLFNKEGNPVKWEKAASACKSAIDYAEANGHQLYSDYGSLFISPYNEEEIFIRSYWSGNVDLDEGLRSNLDTYFNSPSNSGWTSLCPTQDMVESYETLDGKKISDSTSGYKLERFWENRDPRLAQSILYDGSQWKGRQIETFLPGGVDSNEAPVGNWNYSVTGYFVKKFLKEDVIPGDYDTKRGSPQHNIIFRLAELYLNYAETQIELGHEIEAKKYINMVRDRSGMPSINDNGFSLKERYRNERKVELFMENHRYHDLRRWEIASSTMNDKFIRGVEIKKSDNGVKSYSVVDRQKIFFPEKYRFVPIPKDEIDRSGNILKQNPGY